MNRSILPARALRLTGAAHRRVVFVVLFQLLVLALFAAGTWWFASEALEIGRDQALWERGVSANGGSVDATRHSKFGLSWFISNYEGRVSFTDDAGVPRGGGFSFWTVLGGPDTETTELRYDAKHPDQFVISWAVDASGARWRASLFLGGLSLGLSLFMLFLIRGEIRDHLAYRQLAREGDEVVLRVLARAPIPQRKDGWLRFQFELPGDGGAPPRTISRDLPSVYECQDGYALALWRPEAPKQVLLLRADLSPLQLTSDERDQAMARTPHA